MTWSPDGRMLATPSNDESIGLYDYNTQKILHKLNGHTSWVIGLAWSPDGKFLASCSWDKTVRIWDVKSGSCTNVLKKHQGIVHSVAWNSNGKLLASAGEDRYVYIWDIHSGNIIQELSHKNEVNSVLWLAGRNTIITTSDKTVYLWDTTTWDIKNQQTLHTEFIQFSAITFDGSLLATASTDETIIIWDLEQFKSVHVLEKHYGTVLSVSFSGDGRFLASKSTDGKVLIWNCESARVVGEIEEPYDGGWPLGLAFHPTLPILATSEDGRNAVNLWELDFDKLLELESQEVGKEQAAKQKADKFSSLGRASHEIARSKSFRLWAGDDRVILAIVFTDIIGSTVLTVRLGDAASDKLRQDHFKQGRELIQKYNGHEIKTIGDSFMIVFKNVDNAFDFAMEFYQSTGNDLVKIRTGIHLGSATVEEEDLFGYTVNYAARVIGAVKTVDFLVSDIAKYEITQNNKPRPNTLKWKRHEVTLKGFEGSQILWELEIVDIKVNNSQG